VNGQPDAADLEALLAEAPHGLDPALAKIAAENFLALSITPDDLKPSPDLLESFDSDEESLAARAEIAASLAEVAPAMQEWARTVTLRDLTPTDEEFAEIDGLEAWWAGLGPPPAPKFAYLPIAPLVRSRQRPRAPRTRRTRRVRIRSGSRGDPPGEGDDDEAEPPGRALARPVCVRGGS
jgi:hypothetical protein